MASNQSGLEDIAQISHSSTEKVDQLLTAMDTNLEASDGTGAMNEATSLQDPVPTLGDAIIDVVKKRKTFGQSDVAFILDPRDLTKTILISHHQFDAATNLPQITAADIPSEIKYAYLLKSVDGGAQMPHLETIDLAQAANNFYDQFRTIQNNIIKTEDQSPPISEDERGTDWQGAYKAFLAMIIGASRPYITNITNLLSNRDGEPAVSQIQAIIRIASYYGAVSAFQSSMESVLRKFQERSALWKAIAADPVSWLSIGRAVQDKMVFEEAIIHLVGAYPIYGDQMRRTGISDELRQLVEQKSQRLKYYRMGIDQELLTMSIQPEGEGDGDAKSKKKAASKRERTPGLDTMLTIHQWRDYVATQIRNLDDANVVPFYRNVNLSGDSYLPADELIREWPDQVELYEDTVRETLKRLKKEASKLVEPLVKSKLKLEKEELQYLTCVEVEESDIPWKLNEDVEMGEDCFI